MTIDEDAALDIQGFESWSKAIHEHWHADTGDRTWWMFAAMKLADKGPALIAAAREEISPRLYEQMLRDVMEATEGFTVARPYGYGQNSMWPRAIERIQETVRAAREGEEQAKKNASITRLRNRMSKAEAEAARYREALERIAAPGSVAMEDIETDEQATAVVVAALRRRIDIARIALSETHPHPSMRSPNERRDEPRAGEVVRAVRNS